MGGKDMTQKMLEEHNDVFADIINVLLFDGEEAVMPEELHDIAPRSVYEAEHDGRLHEQERDVAKLWVKGDIRIAFVGIENFSRPDRDAPLRVIGYDGASYRSQIAEDDADKRGKNKPGKRLRRYPVVTVVLNFDWRKRWNKPKTMLECFGKIPQKLLPYINDYKITVFDIAFLSDEQAALFRSDFRILADFLIQKRKQHESGHGEMLYKQLDHRIIHVLDTLRALSAVSGNRKFADSYDVGMEEKEMSFGEIIFIQSLEKGRAEGMEKGRAEGMEKGMEKGRAEGMEKGMAKGRAEGLIEGFFDALFGLVKKGLLSVKDAAEQANVTFEEFTVRMEAWSAAHGAN